MEHRWGERTPGDIPVQVSIPPTIITAGRILNISISGAWIRGRFSIAPLARAFVVFDFPQTGGSESLPVACYVARVRPGGIGVEWRELAPHMVSDLRLLASGNHPIEEAPAVAAKAGDAAQSAAASAPQPASARKTR